MNVGEATIGQVVWLCGRQPATVEKVNPNGTVWVKADDEEWNGLWAPWTFTAQYDPTWTGLEDE